MCLDTVTSKIGRLRPRTGYKTFIKQDDGSYEGAIRSNLYEAGVWYFCEDPLKKLGSKDKYWNGFHVLATKRDAQKYGIGFGEVLCKVEFLYPVAEGIDCDGRVVIAQAMRIIEEVKVK